MELLNWQYLTSKDGVPVLVALIGVAGALITAIVGVAATILVQVLAARSTRKREMERLEFDRARWLHEQEVAAATRFEEAKREAYVGWIMSWSELIDFFKNDYEDGIGESSVSPIRLMLSRSMRRDLHRLDRDFKKHSAAVGLLSPELRLDVEPMLRHVSEVDLRSWTGDWFEQLVELGEKVVESMQRSLGIGVPALPGKTSTQQDSQQPAAPELDPVPR